MSNYVEEKTVQAAVVIAKAIEIMKQDDEAPKSVQSLSGFTDWLLTTFGPWEKNPEAKEYVHGIMGKKLWMYGEGPISRIVKASKSFHKGVIAAEIRVTISKGGEPDGCFLELDFWPHEMKGHSSFKIKLFGSPNGFQVSEARIRVGIETRDRYQRQALNTFLEILFNLPSAHVETPILEIMKYRPKAVAGFNLLAQLPMARKKAKQRTTK